MRKTQDEIILDNLKFNLSYGEYKNSPFGSIGFIIHWIKALGMIQYDTIQIGDYKVTLHGELVANFTFDEVNKIPLFTFTEKWDWLQKPYDLYYNSLNLNDDVIIAKFMAITNPDGSLYSNIKGGYPEGTLHFNTKYFNLNYLKPFQFKTFQIERDWNNLMPVVEKIHNNYLKQNVQGRDLFYTIEYLLGGGFRHGSTSSLLKLELTPENLYKRIVMFLKYKTT